MTDSWTDWLLGPSPLTSDKKGVDALNAQTPQAQSVGADPLSFMRNTLGKKVIDQKDVEELKKKQKLKEQAPGYNPDADMTGGFLKMLGGMFGL